MGKSSLFGFRWLANEIQAAGTTTQTKNIAREIPHSQHFCGNKCLYLEMNWMPVVEKTFYTQFRTHSGERDHPGRKEGRNNFGLLLTHLLKYHIINSQSKVKRKR